jgi:hypothetical protein
MLVSSVNRNCKYKYYVVRKWEGVDSQLVTQLRLKN